MKNKAMGEMIIRISEKITSKSLFLRMFSSVTRLFRLRMYKSPAVSIELLPIKYSALGGAILKSMSSFFNLPIESIMNE